MTQPRLVPPRSRRRKPVDCHTCDDLKVVSRIRGGQTFGQPCPDCNGGSW